MTKYKLSPEAKDDLIRIYSYGISKFGKVQAEVYLSELLNCFDRISKNPYHYQSVNHIVLGYRRYVHKSDSIYYRIVASTVEIMAIVGRQDFG
ncbi:type II toxin-antitoxin system RelE/ParE family toxin [Flagellimonas sp.]|uniref:type II toxin-antitoxin system RelE/ParE family toxin n=1 Tax=Flagellimonas sp. TaxID=2058762 RepID=UPI003F4A0B32